MDEYMGIIKLFAGTYAPQGWEFCTGKLLPISQNAALFSLLGTQFGGDGVTTFALPDLRGRVPIGAGQGAGLTDRPQGLKDGAENVTLNASQMPTHMHSFSGNIKIKVADANGNTSVANGSSLAKKAGDIETAAALEIYNNAPTYNSNFALGGVESTGVISTAGNSQPHENMQPFLAINYIICTQGLYPQRP